MFGIKATIQRFGSNAIARLAGGTRQERCSRKRLAPRVEALEGRRVLSPLLYSHDGENHLYTVDARTGKANVIGTMQVTMTDIAFNAVGKLYGVDAGSSLYTIDTTNAQVTTVGAIGSFVNALVFATDGTLYGAGDDFYRIDPTTGAGTFVGDLGDFASAGDLAFDRGGNLYLSTTTDELVAVDRRTGLATGIGPLGFAAVLGMALGSDGVIYGLSDRTEEIISIDLATGHGTHVSSFDDQGVSGAMGASALPGVPFHEVSIGDAAVTEGNSGQTLATFRVTLVPPSELPVSVFYRTVGGTAREGIDYVPTSGTLRFLPGEVLHTISVPVLGDTIHEGDEFFSVALGLPASATLGRGVGGGKIVDDDAIQAAGVLQFESFEFRVSEGSGLAAVRITRTGGTTGAVSARLATSNSLAVAGSDYTAISEIVSFEDGDAGPRIVYVPILDDTVPEGVEYAFLTLSDPVGGATLGPLFRSAITIKDDDPTPIAPWPLPRFLRDEFVARENVGTVRITVVLDRAPRSGFRVGYATEPLTNLSSSRRATSELDYRSSRGTLRFGKKQTRMSFVVTLKADSLSEGDERLGLILFDVATGRVLARAQLVIVDAPLPRRLR